MSAEVAVLVPVLDRAHRVVPTLTGFNETGSCRVLFIADPDDEPEIKALKAAGAEYIAPGGNYASKIAAGVAATDEPYVFAGADDLEPVAGWFEMAKAAISNGAEVVGVNDLIDRDRHHATHFLMTRAYAEQPTIDGDQGPFCSLYWHWFCDDELIATAEHRGVYAYAPDAHVRHLHPIADRAEDDETYRRGRARVRQDRRLFRRRQQLWA